MDDKIIQKLSAFFIFSFYVKFNFHLIIIQLCLFLPHALPALLSARFHCHMSEFSANNLCILCLPVSCNVNHWLPVSQCRSVPCSTEAI